MVSATVVIVAADIYLLATAVTLDQEVTFTVIAF